MNRQREQGTSLGLRLGLFGLIAVILIGLDAGLFGGGHKRLAVAIAAIIMASPDFVGQGARRISVTGVLLLFTALGLTLWTAWSP